MRTEHELFLVLGITPKSRVKLFAQWRSLSLPVACFAVLTLNSNISSH